MSDMDSCALQVLNPCASASKMWVSVTCCWGGNIMRHAGDENENDCSIQFHMTSVQHSISKNATIPDTPCKQSSWISSAACWLRTICDDKIMKCNDFTDGSELLPVGGPFVMKKLSVCLDTDVTNRGRISAGDMGPPDWKDRPVLIFTPEQCYTLSPQLRPRTTWEMKYYDGCERIKSMKLFLIPERQSVCSPIRHAATDAITESTRLIHHPSHLARTAQWAASILLINKHTHTRHLNDDRGNLEGAKLIECNYHCPQCPLNIVEFIFKLMEWVVSAGVRCHIGPVARLGSDSWKPNQVCLDNCTSTEH